MRYLLCLLIIALSGSAATIRITVSNDAGAVKEDVVITLDPANGTGDQMLKSIRDWRDGQLDGAGDPKFPDTVAGRKAFWLSVLPGSLKRMVKANPYPGLASKRAARDVAGADESTELESGFK